MCIHGGLGKGIPQVDKLNHWEIPVEYSVEPGRHHLKTVVPSPINVQFNDGGWVQPTETSKNPKGLNK